MDIKPSKFSGPDFVLAALQESGLKLYLVVTGSFERTL